MDKEKLLKLAEIETALGAHFMRQIPEGVSTISGGSRMTFEYQQIDVSFLDQTHKNFSQWEALVKEKKAELERLTARKIIEHMEEPKP